MAMTQATAATPTPGATARLSRSPWYLLRQAAGSPPELARKALDFGATLRHWVDARALDARLERLRALGAIDEVPTRVQLVVGSLDMLRFWIAPASADYYADKGIDFTFHQILRVLDDPRSMIDPVGFFSDRDTIIGHLLQVVHANPCYDLQLLESHEDGLEELEAQTEAMIAGTHPRARSIGAIVEDPEYHQRLLAYVRAYRKDRNALAPVRENVAGNEAFEALERTFGTLPAAMRYFCKLPRSPWAAARHLVTVRTFPSHLAEPA